MVKRHFLLVASLLTSLIGNSQAELLKKLSKTEADGLHIGDTVPDLEFDHMFNYPKTKARLSDFRGKLVILDFWNLGCAPCIKAFPKMQKLQDQFQDKLQVLLVNVNDDQKSLDASGFPDKVKSPIIKNTKLPFAMLLGRSPVEYLFPAGTLPYHVWINEEGKIIVMSDGFATTEDRVKNYFEGKSAPIRIQPTLMDMGLSWEDKNRDYKSILNPNSNIVFDNLLYSSIITRNLQVKGFSGNLIDSATGKVIGKRLSGDRIYLFMNTFSYEQYLYLAENRDRVVLEVDNPSEYTRPSIHDQESRALWEEQHVYSYELKLPGTIATTEELIRQKMRQDFEMFFGVKVKIEKRKVNCRILVRKAEEDRIKTRGGQEVFEKREDGNGLLLNNFPFSSFKSALAGSLSTGSLKPFLDETDFPANKRVDMVIRAPLRTEVEVRRELDRYGLDIVEGERVLEVLVITKNNMQ